LEQGTEGGEAVDVAATIEMRIEGAEPSVLDEIGDMLLDALMDNPRLEFVDMGGSLATGELSFSIHLVADDLPEATAATVEAMRAAMQVATARDRAHHVRVGQLRSDVRPRALVGTV
jgi:hypothetical protein